MTEERAQRSVDEIAQEIVQAFKALAPTGQTVTTLENLVRSTVMKELSHLRGREAHMRGAEIMETLRSTIAKLLR